MTVTRTNSLNLNSFQVLSDNKCKLPAPSFQKRVTDQGLSYHFSSICYLSAIQTQSLLINFISSFTVSKDYTNLYPLFFSFMKPFHLCKAFLPGPQWDCVLAVNRPAFPHSNQLSSTAPYSFPSASPSWNRRGQRATEGRDRGRRKPKLVEGKNREKIKEGGREEEKKRLKNRKGGNQRRKKLSPSARLEASPVQPDCCSRTFTSHAHQSSQTTDEVWIFLVLCRRIYLTLLPQQLTIYFIGCRASGQGEKKTTKTQIPK